MNAHADLNTHKIRSRIQNRLENDRSKIVPVEDLVDNLVEQATTKVENGTPPVDAVWQLLEDREPYDEMTHTERLYTLSFLFTNYGVSPEWLVEDRRVTHAETWDDITWTLCEYALYDVVYSFVDERITESPHKIGGFKDTRSDAVIEDFSGAMDKHPLTNGDVHNWVASLASDVSTMLANHQGLSSEERRDVQSALRKDAVETEEEALHIVVNDARAELITRNPLTTGSFLDALEELYDMDGRESIESEQLSDCGLQGWNAAITSGILWHAMAEAIRRHRETFAADFKHGLTE